MMVYEFYRDTAHVVSWLVSVRWSCIHVRISIIILLIVMSSYHAYVGGLSGE